MYQKPKTFFFEGKNATKAVVLMHGYAGSANDMRLLGRFLERNGYAVYCRNLTGHGTGEPRDILTEGGLDQWLQDTRDSVSYVRDRGYKDIAIIGLSFGGILATRAMEECAEIRCGGTIAAPVMFAGANHMPEKFVEYANLTYHAEKLSDALIAQNDIFLQTYVGSQLKVMETLANQTATRVERINKPFFIAQGTADEMIDPSSAEMLKEALRVPVTFHLYREAGHVLTVNSAHHALEADVLAFLDDNL